MIRAIVLALWASVHPAYAHSSDAPVIASAIAAEARNEFEAALVSFYVLKESAVMLHPNAVAPDALSGQSCGMLQMPCAYVASHTPREQVRWWLTQVRAGYLVSLDSSAPRAWRRFSQAMALLATARGSR